MKKLLCILSALAIALSLAAPAAAENIDLTALTWDELLDLKARITMEQLARDEWQEVEVPQGVYVVGEDIPAGKWTIRCKVGNYLRFAWGESLDESGHDIDFYVVHDIAHLTNPEYKYYESGDDVEYTFDAVEGYYIVIEDAPATFTPFTGNPDFGFKK